MKKYTVLSPISLAIFVFFCFLQPVKALDYLVTEPQIQELELICQTYKANSLKQAQLLQEQKNKLTSLTSSSQLLRESLQKEQTLTKSLNSSLSQSEARYSQAIQENQTLIQDKNKLQLRNSRLLNITIIIGCFTVLENIALITCRKLKIL